MEKLIVGFGKGINNVFYWGSTPEKLIIKRVPESDHVFLTFDDGPDENQTPPLLDMLEKYDAKASFFVVGSRARKNISIVKRMMSDGHQVYSHSIDHEYRHYFQNEKKVKNWILQSLADLSDLTGEPSAVFRPPAGILTPPLIQAAQELNIKLLLWNKRFYDAVWPLNRWHCRWRLSSIRGGDIILLHDKQKSANHKIFLTTLPFLLESLGQRQFGLKKLNEKEF